MMFRTEYEVKSFTSGHEALEFLRGNKVQAVISDQRMPAITGVELLREVRQIAPNTMRLLLAGYSDLEAIVGSINEGQVHRFLPKPVRRKLVAKSIRDAVERYRTLKAVPELTRRHQVEESKQPPTDTTLSNRIIGFMRRLRA